MRLCLFSLVLSLICCCAFGSKKLSAKLQPKRSTAPASTIHNKDDCRSTEELDKFINEEALWKLFINSQSSPQHFKMEDFANLQRIGGNQAVMYKAEYIRTGKTVALKKHRIKSLKVMEDVVGEIESLFKIQGNPYMLKMYGFFTHSPSRSVYIITEYIRGRNLEELIMDPDTRQPQLIKVNR